MMCVVKSERLWRLISLNSAASPIQISIWLGSRVGVRVGGDVCIYIYMNMRACVKKCAGIPMSVKKMKGKEQKVV